MSIKVQLIFENEAGGLAIVQEVAQLARDALSPATLGLTLGGQNGASKPSKAPQ